MRTLTVFSDPYVWIAAFVICTLHIVGALLHGAAKIVNYVNIALHIASIFLLLLLDASMEEALLLYMISALVYVAVNFFKSGKRRGEK